jgi:hypothetical protein
MTGVSHQHLAESYFLKYMEVCFEMEELLPLAFQK